MASYLGDQLVEVQVASQIALAEQTYFTFYTIIIRLEMAEIAKKTIQLATAFLGDQLVASLLANQTNQVEYTLYTEFQLPTKSKSVLSDALVVAVGGGGWRFHRDYIADSAQLHWD